MRVYRKFHVYIINLVSSGFLVDDTDLSCALFISCVYFITCCTGNSSKLHLEDIVDLKNQECVKTVMLIGEDISQ